MMVDILMAIVIAIFLEMLSTINTYLKNIAILLNCITIISIYFICGCKINFIGQMDLSIWLALVIIADEILMFATKYFKR